MSDWHFKGARCHPEGPQQELHEVQQEEPSPAPGEVQPHTPVCAGGHPAGKQISRKGLGVLLDTGLNRSKRCALAAKKAQDVLGCIGQSAACRVRDGVLPLYSALVRPQLQDSLQFWAHQQGTGTENLERVQRRGTEVKKGLNISHTEGTRELGLFTRGFLGGSHQRSKHLRGGCKGDRATLCPVVPSDMTRGNGHRLRAAATG